MARKPTVSKRVSKTAPKVEQLNEVSVSVQETGSDQAANFGAEYRSRCGGALRANREKQGLSTQDVAGRLRLSVKQIEAMEADNFAALPEATIVKGFIRNYAKLLKINAEPLLDAYHVIVPERSPQSFTLRPSANMKVTTQEKPSIKRYILTGSLAVLGLCTWLFYQGYIQKPNPVTPSADLSQHFEDTPSEVALPAAEQTPGEVVTQLELPESQAAESSAPASEASPVDTNSAPATQAGVDATTQSAEPQAAPPQDVTTQAIAPIATDSGKSKLEFNATQETWISVVDTSGNEIYNRTLFAGNREVIEAKPPLNITVGNALGTTLSVNNKPIDLAPHTRTNVAHVKVD